MSGTKHLRRRSPCFLPMGSSNRKRPATSRFFCSKGGQTRTPKKGNQMQSTRQITIEHIVIASNQPYGKVLEGLASRLGSEEGWRKTEQRIQALAAASWKYSGSATGFPDLPRPHNINWSRKSSHCYTRAFSRPLLSVLSPSTRLAPPSRKPKHRAGRGKSSSYPSMARDCRAWP